MFRRIGDFFARLKKRIKSKDPRRTVIILLICFLLIIIPSVFAVFYAYFHEDSAFVNADRIKAELYDSEGILMFEDEVTLADISSTPTVAMLCSLESKKVPTSLTKSEIKNEVVYKLIFRGGDEVDEYKCYFSDSHSDSFLENSRGVLFSVDQASYITFLNSEYSEAAYSASAPPKLITADGEEVLPRSVFWQYKKRNGNFKNSSRYTVAESNSIVYRIGGSVNLGFTVLPDSASVKISDPDGKEIFSGKPDELSSLSAQIGNTMHAVISAVWNSGSGKDYYGEINYSFDIILTESADFEISSQEIYPEQLVMISAENTENISEISYRFLDFEPTFPNDTDYEKLDDAEEFLLNYRPVFTTDGKLARAVFPIPDYIPEGNITFSLKYGASVKEFALKILGRPEAAKQQTQMTSEEIREISSGYTGTYLNELVSESAYSPGLFMLFKDNFYRPENNGFTLKHSFGDIIVPLENEESNGNNSDGKVSDEDNTDGEGKDMGQLNGQAEYRYIGNTYTASTSNNVSVPVINAGIVVQAGRSEEIGCYVTVDHGMGICSLYVGLFDIDVRVGDILSAGDSVGKSGISLYNPQNGFYLITTAFGTLLEPSFILNTLKY